MEKSTLNGFHQFTKAGFGWPLVLRLAHCRD